MRKSSRFDNVYNLRLENARYYEILNPLRNLLICTTQQLN